MFKEIMGFFWVLYFRFQEAFERRDIEKIGSRWGSVVDTGLRDTTDINEGVDNLSGDVGHDILHSVLFKTLKDCEDRLDLLYEMEELLGKALAIAEDEAKADEILFHSICPQTEKEIKQVKSLWTRLDGQIDYWEGVKEDLLREESDDTDTFVPDEDGYNMLQWGYFLNRCKKFVFRIEQMYTLTEKSNGEVLKELYRQLKTIKRLRFGAWRMGKDYQWVQIPEVVWVYRMLNYKWEKVHLCEMRMPYIMFLKARLAINANIVKNPLATPNQKSAAAHYYTTTKAAIAKKEAETATRVAKVLEEKRSRCTVEINDLNGGSYRLNIEDALDKYWAAKKLADKNGVDVRDMADMLDEEQEPKPVVESFLTHLIDVLNDCQGVKAMAARKLGLTKHKFNKLFESAVQVSKTYYN